MAVNQPSRIQPVTNSAYYVARPTSARQAPVSVSFSPAVKSFFGDVWAGGKDQLKADANKVLHPINTINRALDTTPRQAVKRFFAPYKQDFASGHGGRAIGRVLARGLEVAGLVYGARALTGGGFRWPSIGGGASVGSRSAIGVAFDTIVGTIRHTVRGVSNAVGGFFARLIPGGARLG